MLKVTNWLTFYVVLGMQSYFVFKCFYHFLRMMLYSYDLKVILDRKLEKEMLLKPYKRLLCCYWGSEEYQS